MENISWPNLKGKKRCAVVNSFGAHGGNTTVLLRMLLRRKRGEDPRSSDAVTVSAKSRHSLRGNIAALLSYLDLSPDTSLGDLSYTVSTTTTE